MLLCAPSLGVLDNWLPVLHAAREARRTGSGWRIIALIPEPAILAQLDPSDTAHRLADELIDATVAPLVDGGWVVAPGFLAIAPLARSRLLRTRRQRAALVDPALLDDPANRLLYDIHLHKKPALTSLLALFGTTPRCSYNHGLILEQRGERHVRIPNSRQESAVFVFGPDEVAAYAENFGVRPDSIEVVGAPRHEPTWVEHVVRRSRDLHSTPFEEAVFVISRPADSSYLPRDRKVRALRALHHIAWEEHGLPLVLRTHPKESADGALEEALPRDGEGVSWARSGAHPFHLARHSRLAVAFFSGVVIDMVALGVPVVELLDVRGLPEHDHDGVLRDPRGRPMFGPYRADGLVVPADDIDDLRDALTRITHDRDGVLRGLTAAMRARFADPTDGARRMLARISA